MWIPYQDSDEYIAFKFGHATVVYYPLLTYTVSWTFFETLGTLF